MVRLGRSWSLFAFSVLSGSCGLLIQPNNDGVVCRSDDDCSSGRCGRYNVCSHSSCSCSGADCEAGVPSDECRDDWVCKFFPDNGSSWLDPDIFDDDAHTSCIPLCANGCPEHYECGETYCKPIADWAAPIVTVSWDGPSPGAIMSGEAWEAFAVPEGTELSFSVALESPLGADIDTVEWYAEGGSGDTQFGDEATFMTAIAGGYREVRVEVRDTEGYTSESFMMHFYNCADPGDSCQYNYSGCCSGSCDMSTNTCD